MIINHNVFQANTTYAVYVPEGAITNYLLLIAWGFISGTVNSSPIVAENQTSIYPNPSNGRVNIEVSQNSIIRILDLSGRIVDTFNIDGDSTLDFVQPAGIYIIHIESKGKIETHKLIIQ